MEKIRLLMPVLVAGPDIFGRPAKITFSPTSSWGWFWKTDEKYLAITSSLAFHKARRVSLQNGAHQLEVYEHIGPLRWTGLDGVMMESSRFPPYFGRSSEFWEALRPSCFVTKQKVSWLTISQSVKATHADDPTRYLEMHPLNGGRPYLKVVIIVDYLKFGFKERVYQFPGQSLKKIMKARTLGWPPWLYYFSLYGPRLFWLHHHRIAWPQQCPRDLILEHILNHRVADLLGVLSLFSNQGLLAGEIISHCAGHEADVNLLKAIQPYLCPL